MARFESVEKSHIKNHDIFTDEKNRKITFPKEVRLPIRADKGSAGSDFYVPKDIIVLPGQEELIWTDVKAYMEEDEVLYLHIRSSLAIKHGLRLTNIVGVIDFSYYSNQDNDGNIGVSIKNTSGKAYTLKEGDRFCQGVFHKYIIPEENEVLKEERTGGIGSSEE